MSFVVDHRRSRNVVPAQKLGQLAQPLPGLDGDDGGLHPILHRAFSLLPGSLAFAPGLLVA